MSPSRSADRRQDAEPSLTAVTAAEDLIRASDWPDCGTVVTRICRQLCDGTVTATDLLAVADQGTEEICRRGGIPDELRYRGDAALGRVLEPVARTMMADATPAGAALRARAVHEKCAVLWPFSSTGHRRLAPHSPTPSTRTRRSVPPSSRC